MFGPPSVLTEEVFIELKTSIHQEMTRVFVAQVDLTGPVQNAIELMDCYLSTIPPGTSMGWSELAKGHSNDPLEVIRLIRLILLRQVDRSI